MAASEYPFAAVSTRWGGRFSGDASAVGAMSPTAAFSHRCCSPPARDGGRARRCARPLRGVARARKFFPPDRSVSASHPSIRMNAAADSAGAAQQGFRPGVPNGMLGQRTPGAVQDWQQSRGALSTGYLTGAEVALLQVAPAVAVPEPAPPAAVSEAYESSLPVPVSIAASRLAAMLDDLLERSFRDRQSTHCSDAVCRLAARSSGREVRRRRLR